MRIQKYFRLLTFSTILFFVLSTSIKGSSACSEKDKAKAEAERIFKETKELEKKANEKVKTEERTKAEAEVLDNFIYIWKICPTEKYLNEMQRIRFHSVRALIHQGFYKKAEDMLADLIKEKPYLPIPSDLEYLGRPTSAWPKTDLFLKQLNRHADKIRRILVPLLTDLLFLLSIPLFFCSIYLLIKNILSKKIYLEIKDFNDENIMLQIGKSTTAIFKKSLLKSGEIGERPNVNIAFEPIGKFEPSIDLSKTVPPLDVLFRLFQSIRAQSFNLSGFGEEDAAKGLGLTLILKSSDNTVHTQTFWQQDYDPEMISSKNKDVGSISKLLAKPAAIWAIFTIDPKSAKQWIGFSSWQSYAYSIAGGDWVRKNSISNAEKILNKSLIYNATNRFSLFNLGVLKIQGGADKNGLFTARTLLERAKSSIENNESYKFFFSPACKEYFTDVVWYKIMYQLSSLDEYECIENSIDLNTENITTLTNSISFFIENKDFYCSEYLVKFLLEFRPMCQIMYASMLVRKGCPECLNDAKEKIEIILREYKIAPLDSEGNVNILLDENQQFDRLKQILPFRAYYNLACYYAALAQAYAPENEAKKSEEIGNLFRYLKFAIMNERSLAKWARIDPSFKWIREESDKSKEFFQFIYLY